jgi:ABC-type branched-subunit amino acid transport system ATPase component
MNAEAVTPVLDLDRVSVRFGGVSALQDVSVTVAPRDVVAVIGSNGAGKSTMLNAVCGLVRENTTGSIEICGQRVLGRRPEAIARLSVSRSFQDPPLIDAESVLENILVGEHLRLGYRMGDQLWRRGRVRRREAEARQRAIAMLEFIGLENLGDERVGGLPYGTRKLIDIARAMVSEPVLLLLDEPTSGLDADEQEAVGRVLQQLHRATSVSMLVVEHHMNIVRAVATKVIGLQSGSVLMVGTAEEVLESEEFRAATVGTSNEYEHRSPMELTTNTTEAGTG